MTAWINQMAVDATAASSHTIDISNPTAAGTVITGSAFSPTSGNLLVAFVGSDVLTNTPTGWTLRNSQVSSDGTYCFSRTADGTSADQLATSHNASVEVMFEFFEFDTDYAYATSAGTNGSTLKVDSLTGYNVILCVVTGPPTSGTWAWNPTEPLTDYNVAGTYHYGSSYAEDWSYPGAVVVPTLESFDGLIVAISAPAPSGGTSSGPVWGLVD